MRIIEQNYNNMPVRFLIEDNGEVWLNFTDFIDVNTGRN